MLKLLAVLALVSASVAHRFKGAAYKQTKNATDYEYKSLTWDEAHEYEECDWIEDEYKELEKGNKDGEGALNGMHHFLSRHHPKLIEDICANVTIGDVSRKVCPDFTREESAHCGFETVVIPPGKWIVADIDVTDRLGVRNAYKKKIAYGYRDPNSVRFMVPVILKWRLNKELERVRGEIAMYIPEERQNNPGSVVPGMEKEVRIEEWKETKVYLRPYGGHRDDVEFKQQYELLRKAVSDAGLFYKDNEEWEAGYTYLRYGRQRIDAIVVDNGAKA